MEMSDYDKALQRKEELDFSDKIKRGGKPVSEPGEIIFNRGGKGGIDDDSVGLGGKRTAFAEFILYLGIFSFGSGALLYIIHWIMPSVVGVNLAQGLLGGGLSCILFVSFFKVFFYILILGAVSILMADGSKPPDGFSMSNIPMQSYLAAIGMVAFAFVLRRVLSRP